VDGLVDEVTDVVVVAWFTVSDSELEVLLA
jgi:hypothetical protein